VLSKRALAAEQQSREDLQAQLSSSEEKQHALLATLAAEQQKREDLQAQLSSSEERQQALFATLAAEQQKREGLQAQLSSSEARLSSSEARLLSSKARLSSSEEKQHALLATLAAEQLKREDLQAERKDLLKDKKRYEAYEKEADRDIRQTREDAKAKIAKSEAARRAAAQADQADLESVTLLHAAQRTALFKELNEARRQRDSAEQKAAQLKQELEARDQDDYK